jgi:hypothetical protein
VKGAIPREKYDTIIPVGTNNPTKEENKSDAIPLVNAYV